MFSFQRSKDILRSVCPEGTFRSQPESDWMGNYPLPDAVAEYFRELGPVDLNVPAYGNNIELPSLKNLWDQQLGYRIHGVTHERLAEWEDDWLVIGNQGGDPFIVSRNWGAVLHAFHGDGNWNPEITFDSLAEMTAAVAVLGQIVEESGDNLTNEDCLVRPSHLDLAANRLIEFGFQPVRAREIPSLFGWH